MIRAWLGRADRLQQTLAFKVIASIVVLSLAIGSIVTYGVRAARREADLPLLAVVDTAKEASKDAGKTGAHDSGKPDGASAGRGDRGEEDAARAAAEKAQRESALATVNAVNQILERRLSVVDFAVGASIVSGVALVVIWLGLALTYLGIALAAALFAFPLIRWGSPGLRGLGLFSAGVLALACSFSAIIQALRLALSRSHPITSIARNVVDEAIRMKISLIFIVLLVFGLAALPGALDTSSPLRYRVQAFLTYGVQGSYMVIAALTVFLACATVAFEQRDKIIWQTMTKPVQPWQYVLGKWLGVSLVALGTLVVAASGVYMFTEYLRSGVAQGERAPFVSINAEAGEALSPDRLMLETQVLTARKSVIPTMPTPDPAELEKEITRRIEKAKQNDSAFADTPDARRKMTDGFYNEQVAQYLAVPPGQDRTYVFRGLEFARQRSAPIVLRFKPNAGNNLPTETYRLSFFVGGAQPIIREVRLGQMTSLPLSPAALQEATFPDGTRDTILEVQVFNGDVVQRTMNRETVSFPVEGGLQISYPVDTFRGNFARIIGVVWLKLCFLAAVGIAASTFLSFPVAALFAFGFMATAESIVFMREALDSYGDIGYDKEWLWWRLPVIWIAEGVSYILSFYGKYDPAANIADGRLVAWGTLANAVGVFGCLTAAVGALAAAIFRRRELATYSGQ